MTIAIASIQRDRAPWLMEWVAFHLVAGFERIYLYTHKCSDGTTELAARLARHYPLVVHPFEGDDRPQLAAYQHAVNQYAPTLEWLAFIDGDEFLHPVRAASMREALAPFAARPLSALAAYWMCYGSSGHLSDPPGLVLEQFTRHAEPGFAPNRHVKTLLRGGEPGVVVTGSHVFATPRGTFDERGRSVDRGWMSALEPSWDILRINHYAVQSWDYYLRSKRTSGAADGRADLLRPESWFRMYDRNECDDGMRWRWLLPLKRQLREMQERLAADARAPAAEPLAAACEA